MVVGGALPFHQALDEGEELLAALIDEMQLSPVGRLRVRSGQLVNEVEELLGDAFLAGVVDEGGEEDGAAGGEGAASPPEVQGARMAFRAVLLVSGLLVDGVEGDGDFDELFAVGHGFRSVRWS